MSSVLIEIQKHFWKLQKDPNCVPVWKSNGWRGGDEIRRRWKVYARVWLRVVFLDRRPSFCCGFWVSGWVELLLRCYLAQDMKASILSPISLCSAVYFQPGQHTPMKLDAPKKKESSTPTVARAGPRYKRLGKAWLAAQLTVFCPHGASLAVCCVAVFCVCDATERSVGMI